MLGFARAVLKKAQRDSAEEAQIDQLAGDLRACAQDYTELRAAIRALPRYAVSDLDDMLLLDPRPDGNWVNWADLLRLLDEFPDPQTP